VDNFTLEMAAAMKSAGCERVFFGIESGDDTILRQMKKKVTVEDARRATEAAVKAGLKAAGFFIIGYPGENNSTMLRTIRLATQLPLDYVSFSLPYPIPGTGLYDRLEDKFRNKEWRHSPWRLIDHSLLYESEFSELKLKFAIAKGSVQHRIMKHLGRSGYAVIGKPFEAATDLLFARLD
jgi:anaerobic magnesium-protoporphyrin IX monomethyl ester cyclase